MFMKPMCLHHYADESILHRLKRYAGCIFKYKSHYVLCYRAATKNAISNSVFITQGVRKSFSGDGWVQNSNRGSLDSVFISFVENISTFLLPANGKEVYELIIS